MLIPLSFFQQFRKELYMSFTKRKDAIMNLLDALTSDGGKYDSVVQLSNSSFFEREYSSITDAISDGLLEVKWNKITQLILQHNGIHSDDSPYKIIIDCTPNPRAHSKKLSDRYITHAPNPAPGNKPICVGSQYSAAMLLPHKISSRKKHWLILLSVKRVKSSQKGNETGMEQIIQSIKDYGLEDKTCISIGDSLYGTERCRKIASQQDNLVHIFRFNSNRNIFFKPTEQECAPKGRTKEFGAKMHLNDISTHLPHNDSTQTQMINCKGKEYTISIKRWNNVLLRGSRQFRSSHYPLNLVQITVTNQKDKTVFKKPLWLAVFGKRRHEIDLVDIYKHYVSRYDIEHFFRFGKRNLLMNSYQTPDVEHEELWWKLCMLAYVQLYMAKDMVKCIPQPWERYLPAYKHFDEDNKTTMTPSQTQRGFADLLTVMGTPAKKCQIRGKSLGRIAGEKPKSRMNQSIIFKTKKSPIQAKKNIISGYESTRNISNPQKIDGLLSMVHIFLENLKISPEKFYKLLINYP